MPDSYVLSAADYRRMAAVIQWAERRMQLEPRPPTGPTPVPLGTLRRFGVTVADPDSGTYPAPADRPNTYWVKWQSATWDITTDPKQGRKTRTLTWLEDLPKIETDKPSGYGVAHHYADLGAANGHYVPEGTLVLCSWHNDRWWFTHSRATFVAKLGVAELDSPGNARRWKYPFTEQVKTGDGYDEWADLAGGRTGYLRNTVETPNAGAEAVEAATANALVEAWEERYVSNGVPTTEYWFQWESATRWPHESDGSTGGGTTIDVVICNPWNRCGSYIVFPQRRIHLPPGAWIETLADTVVPIYQCQSSGDGSGGDDGGSLGESSGTDECIWCLRVSGTLTPDATGDYHPLQYRINGHCVWRKAGTDWYILWEPTWNYWMVYQYASDPALWWFKEGGAPIGDYGVGPNVEGLATVASCG